MTVEVGEETIPGWTELQDAGILQWVGQLRWPALEQNGNVDQLVQSAESPWLVAWTQSITE